MPDAGDIPHGFLCPISLDMMSDPVTVSSGHTFDRPSIAAWLSTGNSTCPLTRSPISSDLIPNLTLRRLIRHWCSSHRLSRSLRGILISILFSSESESESQHNSDELRNDSLADCNSMDSDTDRVMFLLGLMLEPSTIDVIDAVIKDGIFFRRAETVGVKDLLAGAAEALADVVVNTSDLERGDTEAALAASELLCRVPAGCAAFAESPLIGTALVRKLLKVSESATEHAVGLLLSVCSESERARREAAEAGVVTRLLLVLQSGATLTGKRKAGALLKLLQSSWPRDCGDFSENCMCDNVVPY